MIFIYIKKKPYVTHKRSSKWVLWMLTEPYFRIWIKTMSCKVFILLKSLKNLRAQTIRIYVAFFPKPKTRWICAIREIRIRLLKHTKSEIKSKKHILECTCSSKYIGYEINHWVLMRKRVHDNYLHDKICNKYIINMFNLTSFG